MKNHLQYQTIQPKIYISRIQERWLEIILTILEDEEQSEAI
jgi:hypothetical protein